MTMVLYGGKAYNNNPAASAVSMTNSRLPVFGVSLLPLIVMLIGGLP